MADAYAGWPWAGSPAGLNWCLELRGWSEGASPFSVLSAVIEPLGLLHGPEAEMSVALRVGRWLRGGPTAFTLVRLNGQVFPVSHVPDVWQAEVRELEAPLSDWAGLGAGPLVMGILNVTPDSFSDGGDLYEPSKAIAVGERMLAGGVDIVDVGGESTRPGAQALPPDLEQVRIRLVIRALARQGAVLSIDSRNATTMGMALDEGARIVNDVSALLHDANALPLVAQRKCPVILMHMRGTPATMMDLCDYDDVADDVGAALSARITAVQAAGILRKQIVVDPGIGFAKTAGQSVELVRRLPMLLGIGCPILVGISRKATIGVLGRESDPKARGPGSVAAALFAIDRGARIVRVHDAIETAQALRVWRGLSG